MIIYFSKKLIELTPEDLTGETNEKAFFNAKQINENVKIDETPVIEVDQILNDKKTVQII